jgi:hypothetical protein
MNETVCYGCEYSDIQTVTKTLNDIGISNDIIAVILIVSIIVIVSVLLYHIISGLPMRR